MAKSVQKQVEEYKEKCKIEAEAIVKERLPQRVLDLNQLLQSEKLSLSRINNVEVDLNIPLPEPMASSNGPVDEPQVKKRKMEGVLSENSVEGTKVYSLPFGTVAMNTHIREVVTMVKPHILELIENTNQIKMWIAYSIPKIEDGNNFGVSVQEDAMTEARQVESEAATYLDQISRYYTTRAKIISKVAKYPHISDYREAVKELDEKQFLSMRLIVTELRNQYASLHDLILKNYDKIIRPRTSNSDNMY